jgi:hypothetical protein
MEIDLPYEGFDVLVSTWNGILHQRHIGHDSLNSEADSMTKTFHQAINGVKNCV